MNAEQIERLKVRHDELCELFVQDDAASPEVLHEIAAIECLLYPYLLTEDTSEPFADLRA